jgi:low temperature requirement protein LtrA
VAIGIGAADHDFDAELIAGVVFSLLVTIGLWWTYFDRVAHDAEEHLRTHDEPVLAAADAYSYLHLLMVTGIIVFAVGAKSAVAHAADPLSDAARLALCGGVALYLVGHAAFGLRLAADLSRRKLAAALGCGVVFVVAGGLPAWATAGVLAGVLAMLVTVETAAQPRSRAA